jgi:hypothetical protein
VKDAVGKELAIGQVVVHFHVKQSHMVSNLGIIRGFNKSGSIALDVPKWHYVWSDETGYQWDKPRVMGWCKSTCKVSEYLVVTDMTEEEAEQCIPRN